MRIDSRIKFCEAVNTEAYKIVTYYFDADVSVLEELGFGYSNAIAADISIDFPMNKITAKSGTVAISPVANEGGDDISYDWTDIYLPPEDIQKLIDIANEAMRKEN